MDGNSSPPPCREYTGPRNFQHSSLQATLDDHGKVVPVTGIEVLQAAGTLFIGVQVPSRQPRNSKFWVHIYRRLAQYAPQFIPKETDHKISDAALSPLSSSCGRPRAQTTDEHSTVRHETASKTTLIFIGFSQRDWKIITAKAKHKKGL